VACNKTMDTRIFPSTSFVIAGTVLLLAASAFSQTLFVTAGTYDDPLTPIVTLPNGNVYEVAPGGRLSDFAGNLGLVRGITFDNAGNIFLASP
jgi:hypothetical protein